MSTAVTHSTDKVPTLYEIWIDFCERTTIRGLPRAVKEPNLCWKMIWYVSTLVLFIFAVAQISYLYNDYIKYDIIQQESTKSEVHYHFPSITVCNLNPIRGNADTMSEHLHLTGLPKYLRSKQNFYKYIEELEQKYPDAFIYLEKAKSTLGFFHNLPPHVQQEFGHQRADFISSCSIVVSTGYNVVRDSKCEEARITRSPLFFNCFTIFTNSSNADNVTTLSIVLYLNEYYDSIDSDMVTQKDILENYLGVKLVIHEVDTFPDIDHSSTKIGPGLSAWVVLNPKNWHMLGLPYEHCFNDPPEIEHFGIKLKYSRVGCRMQCFQKYLLDKCGCLNPEWPIKDLEGVPLPPFCMNLTKGIVQFVENMKCWKKVEENDHRCNEECPEKCKRFEYGQSVWTSSWPHMANQLAFYNQFIKKQPYADKFKEYEQLDREARKGNNTPYVVQRLGELDLITRNFLQINIHRDFELRIIQERPAYEMQRFLSGVGGILSLSIGITMISVVECLQLCCRVRKTWKTVFFGAPNSSGNRMKQQNCTPVSRPPPPVRRSDVNAPPLPPASINKQQPFLIDLLDDSDITANSSNSFIDKH